MTHAVVLEHKRGDTFEVQCTYTDEDGVAQSLSGITVESQLRTSEGRLVADCVVTVTSEVGGTFTLKVADTSAWPLVKLDWDIQYTLDGGDVVSSDTVRMSVVKDVTQ